MNLSGKILIAMPAMGDPRFEKSVVLLCSHSDQGALGLIVNKPLPELAFSELLDQLGIARDQGIKAVPVQYGGPVEQGRGFVLHGADWHASTGTMDVVGGLAMTATQEVLAALARGQGPARALLALGYAGWGAGQLEAEIARNDWLTADATPDLIFASDNGGKWAGALAQMRIDPLTLSASAGRA
ncbi:MAG: YqgE/AlgH family protein [Gemmobacter sp.]|jgi:putative transcriptional regulator|nr:YqgE/AlgH family protein [Gemmobacter sp.]